MKRKIRKTQNSIQNKPNFISKYKKLTRNVVEIVSMEIDFRKLLVSNIRFEEEF